MIIDQILLEKYEEKKTEKKKKREKKEGTQKQCLSNRYVRFYSIQMTTIWNVDVLDMRERHLF